MVAKTLFSGQMLRFAQHDRASVRIYEAGGSKTQTVHTKETPQPQVWGLNGC